jgi:hypothetical protein
MSTKRGILPTFYSFLEELENAIRNVEQQEPIVTAIVRKDLESLKSKWTEKDMFFRHIVSI